MSSYEYALTRAEFLDKDIQEEIEAEKGLVLVTIHHSDPEAKHELIPGDDFVGFIMKELDKKSATEDDFNKFLE